MASERKINGYVRAAQRHAKLAAKYEAKVEALLPLKRRVQAAEAAVLTRRQKMSGAELSRAMKALSQAEHQGVQQSA